MSATNHHRKMLLGHESPNVKKRHYLVSKYIWFLLLAFPVVAYFVNHQRQSHLGRKAVAETGLEAKKFDNAPQKTKHQDKLVLTEVYAIWCPSCRQLEQRVFSGTEVQKAIQKSFIFAEIDDETEDGSSFFER